MRRTLITLAATAALGSNVLAQSYGTQLHQGSVAEPTKFEEIETPLPAGLDTSRVVPVSVRGSELRFGVVPDSVSIGKDGVTRYVVVATSASGTVNAMQEGIRCPQSEVKVYARYTSGGGWSATRSPAWQPLSSQRHSQALAQAGMCDRLGTTARSVREILQDLSAPGQQPLR